MTLASWQRLFLILSNLQLGNILAYLGPMYMLLSYVSPSRANNHSNIPSVLILLSGRPDSSQLTCHTVIGLQIGIPYNDITHVIYDPGLI